MEIRPGFSFLDGFVEQLCVLNRTYDCDVPLILMNSFSTDAPTRELLECKGLTKKGVRYVVVAFVQRPCCGSPTWMAGRACVSSC